MSNPLISVISPVYNTGKRLLRCLESLLKQDFTDWELILVDDGSENYTASLCDTYAQKDARIHVIHTSNGGVSAARNRGLTHAQGSWIGFIDSDDWVEPGYLQDFVSQIESGADLIMQGYVKERAEIEIGRRHLTDGLVSKAAIPDYFLKNDLLEFGSPCCKLFRRSILLQNEFVFPESYSYGEDTLFFLKYLPLCQSISFIGHEGYHYVENTAESLSQRVHHSLPLLRFVKDNAVAVAVWSGTSSGDEIRLRQNAKNVALSNRAYINMFKLGYSRVEGMSVIKYFQDHVRPCLNSYGISLHDRIFLVLTALPCNLQWPLLVAFRRIGIIKA